MKKAFDIEDVLTVVTGVMLRKGADFQGVMDHLYPGIMTIGCAAMWPTAAEEIQRQHPKLRDFCKRNEFNEADDRLSWCDGIVRAARVVFGSTLEIDGPHEVSNDRIQAAFDDFGKVGAQ